MATQLTHMCDVFNVKVIEYKNGTCEIRKYSKPMGMKNIDSSECFIDNDLFLLREYVYNPFEEKEDYYKDIDFEYYRQKKKENCLKSSMNRTINNLYKVSKQCKWEYFITLTFSSEYVDRFNYSECMKKANKWFNNQKSRYACDLQYIFVPEMHKNGAWHIHGLIANCGNISFVDSGKKVAYRDIIYNLSGWKFGFSTATKIKDTYKVSHYITKYITKDLCSIAKGKKRYFRSQNIAEPIEKMYCIDGEVVGNFIDNFINCSVYDYDYHKSINGDFVNVDYIFLKERKIENEREKL